MGWSASRSTPRYAADGLLPPPRGLKRLLVIEDEPYVRRLLVDLFESEGYLVRDAANGAEGLACLLEFHPDVIILDLMMPVMNGWTFLEEYGRVDGRGDVPIITVSAMYDLERAAEPLRAMDVRAFVPKPFDSDALVALVETLTANRVAKTFTEGRAERGAPQ